MFHSGRHRALAALTVFAFCMLGATSAAADPAPAGLLGAWTCDATDQNGGVKVTTIYLTNGSLASSADGTANTNSGVLEIHLTGSGTWTFAGGNITEQIAHVDLNAASLAGTPIAPGSDVWNSLVTNMTNAATAPNTRKITSLTASSMGVEYEGSPLTCTRG